MTWTYETPVLIVSALLLSAALCGGVAYVRAQRSARKRLD